MGLLAMVMGARVVYGAPAQGSANVAQADLFVEQVWNCTPSPSASTFTDIPELSVSLSTRGGPVLVMLVLNANTPFNAPFRFVGVVDGVEQSQDALLVYPQGHGGYEVLTSTRVYALTAGAHVFGVRAACMDFGQVVRGWITAYELPLIKK
jgi:hypothetical protein